MADIKSYMSWCNGKMFCTRDQGVISNEHLVLRDISTFQLNKLCNWNLMVPCDLIILKCPSRQLMQHELKAGLQSQGRVVDCGMLVPFPIYCNVLGFFYSRWKFITLQNSIHNFWLQFTAFLEF
jgi:hypothetical protein